MMGLLITCLSAKCGAEQQIVLARSKEETSKIATTGMHVCLTAWVPTRFKIIWYCGVHSDTDTSFLFQHFGFPQSPLLYTQ